MAKSKLELYEENLFNAKRNLEYAEALRIRKENGEDIDAPKEEQVQFLRKHVAGLQVQLAEELLSFGVTYDRVKCAALRKCVLNPHGFDNYKLWSKVDSRKLESAVEGLDFCLGGADDLHKNFLGQSQDGNVDYFACWPKIDDVIYSLSQFMKKNEAIDLVNSCCIDSAYRIKKDAQLSPTISSDRINSKKGSSSTSNEFLGAKQLTLSNTKSLALPSPKNVGHASLMLKILGGFMAALGAIAIVLAFTIMSQAFIPAVGVGAGLFVAGFGLFATANNKAYQNTQISSLFNATP